MLAAPWQARTSGGCLGRSRTPRLPRRFIEAHHWLSTHLPYWNRNGGRDHILTAVHDEGSCWVPSVLRPAIHLVHWGRTDVPHTSESGWAAPRGQAGRAPAPPRGLCAAVIARQTMQRGPGLQTPAADCPAAPLCVPPSGMFQTTTASIPRECRGPGGMLDKGGLSNAERPPLTPRLCWCRHPVWQPEGHLGKLQPDKFPCYDPSKASKAARGGRRGRYVGPDAGCMGPQTQAVYSISLLWQLRWRPTACLLRARTSHPHSPFLSMFPCLPGPGHTHDAHAKQVQVVAVFWRPRAQPHHAGLLQRCGAASSRRWSE